MQFVNMDVDRFGSRDRFQLGTFSAGLNAICGPQGSGKSRLVRWLRLMFASNRPGVSVWPGEIDRVHGSVELRSHKDHFRLHGHDNSSANGSRKVELLAPDASLDDHSNRNGGHREGPLSTIQQQAIVDLLSIPSDSAAIGRLQELAQRLELERDVIETRNVDQSYLLAREREIRDVLRRLDALETNRETLVARQRQLESELDKARRDYSSRSYIDSSLQRQRLEEQAQLTEADIRSAVQQVEGLDRLLANCRARLESLDVELVGGGPYQQLSVNHRERLAQLDGQLQRWRQTLRELQTYRDRLNHNATDARLDRQMGEQVTLARQPDPRAALRALESQIINTRRQLDELLGQYDRSRGDDQGDAFVVLPEALRTMQKNLYEVCQHLSLHESLVTRESLIEQSTQFERCESELLCAIEKLIAQRGELLQAIAGQYHVTLDQIALTFGEDCQCEDHPHVTDWLASEAPPVARVPTTTDSAARQRLVDETHTLEDDRRRAAARLDDLQQRLRELQNQLRLLVDIRPVVSASRLESEIVRDFDRATNELHEIENRDRLRVELDEIRRQLLRTSPVSSTDSLFRRAVDRHKAALTSSGSIERHVTDHDMVHRRAARPHSNDSWSPLSDLGLRREFEGRAHYVLRDFAVPRLVGNNYNDQPSSSLPEAILETATRLAIAECLADRGHAIPLVLDGTLDQLHAGWREPAIRYLARIADQSRQQIILFTGDDLVEQLIRDLRGNVLSLSVTRPVAREAVDVNRQLAAYANELEAEKWSKPEPIEPTRLPRESKEEQPRNRFFLTERSAIDQLASIDFASAARLRKMSVDRVGELLDADPRWLADEIHIPSVTESVVRAWQAEASLLCSVPQLRPFDARVLVGGGIRHPQQLAQMHPSRLLDRVEKFLITDRGQEILRSGSNYELSRITSWIASAKNGAPQYRRSNIDDGNRGAHATFPAPSGDHLAHRQHRSAAGPPTYTVVDQEPKETTRTPRLAPRSAPEGRSHRSRAARTNEDRGNRSNRRSDRAGAEIDASAALDARWKFHLDLSSKVAEAPSIGPKMAERLTRHGIKTVQQLLVAHAETLANAIAAKQVSAATVRSWQDQARLVCRIPNLRGHDAELLVRSAINSPEDLAGMQPEVVLQQVLAVARTSEGQRIIRSGKEPDLAEVSNWINWAGHSRSLQAA